MKNKAIKNISLPLEKDLTSKTTEHLKQETYFTCLDCGTKIPKSEVSYHECNEINTQTVPNEQHRRME